MSMFELQNGPSKDGTLGGLVASLESGFNDAGSHFVTQAHRQDVSRVVALESLGDSSRTAVSAAFHSLEQVILREGNKFVDGKKRRFGVVATENDSQFGASLALTSAQQIAGIVAGMTASSVGTFLQRDIGKRPALESGTMFLPSNDSGALERRVLGSERLNALEAYDERENKETTVYSIAYNMQAATQDEFGEALFPTSVVTPDQYGLTISMRLVMVLDDLHKDTTGDVIRDFKRKNIIRAAVEPDVLRNDTTRIIPVVRDEALDKFIAPTLVPPRALVHEGVSITTAPLAIGETIDLTGISQTDALLQTGKMDPTDAIDPNIVLDAIYVQFGTGTTAEVVKFGSLGNVISSTFTAAPQGSSRKQMLNFQTNALPVNPKTTKYDGTASTILEPIVTGNFYVRLAISVHGNVDVQTGETEVSAGKLKVVEIRDANNELQDITTGPGKALADLFVGATVQGYDLEARRVNTNRRERGQLLDIMYQNVIYGVPLLSPITAPRPPAGPQQDEANYLAALITTTRIRTSNAAVQKLLDTEVALADWVQNNIGDDEFTNPEILGVGGWLVKPYYEHRDYVAPAVVDSIKSYERAADIQASLVNMIREITYTMYRESGYKAAANAMHGGIAPPPTVIIATDTYIASYLMVTGDFRTLGNEFNVKVVSTTNNRMKGKIRFTFGEFGEGRDNTPNPLHFGSMAWKPELTIILPTVRNGSNSREISVSPSFRHIVHLPIMGSIDVSGIDQVVNAKVNVNVKSQ